MFGPISLQRISHHIVGEEVELKFKLNIFLIELGILKLKKKLLTSYPTI